MQFRISSFLSYNLYFSLKNFFISSIIQKNSPIKNIKISVSIGISPIIIIYHNGNVSTIIIIQKTTFIFYLLASHLLHTPFFLMLGLTPKIGFAIRLYKNPSRGTLHFKHLFTIVKNIMIFKFIKLARHNLKSQLSC